MLKTFNCGVGFCLITNKKNISKIKKIFSKKISSLMKLALFLKKKKELISLVKFNGK